MRLLERPGPPAGPAAEAVRDPTRLDGEHPLRCRACAHVVTDRALRVEVGGRHAHLRVNSGGFSFLFGCFRDAPGAVAVGAPTGEASWFQGCLWQFAHCGRCQVHLGWRFTGAQAFVALVLERLVEDGEGAG